MRELLLRIRALFEGRAQAQEAEKAIDDVGKATKEVGEEAAAAKPKVDAMLESTSREAKQAAKDLDDVKEKLDEVKQTASKPASSPSSLEDLFPEFADLKRRANALPGGPGGALGEDLSQSVGEDFLKGVREKTEGVEQSLGSLQDLVIRFTAIVTAAKLGWEAGAYVQDQIFNWASSIAAGGLSSEEDQRRTQNLVNDSGRRITEFSSRAAGMSSQDERSGLLRDVEAYQRELIEAKSRLGINETAQRNEMDRTIAQLQTFWEQALAINPELLAQMREAKARAEAEAAARAQADIERQAISQAYRDGQTGIQNNATFRGLSPDEQLRDLRARQRAADTTASNQFGNETPETMAAASRESLALLQQIATLEERISAEKTKQAAAEEKRQAAAQATAQRLETQLRIDAARLAGDEAGARAIEFQIRLEAELATLRQQGITDEEKLQQYAAQKTTIFQQQLTAKREELDIETRLNEAKAQGNLEEAKRLQWVKDVNALKRQGLTDDEAARAVNARLAAAETRETGQPTLAGPAPTTGPIGRASAPLQRSPIGPSALDAPIDITAPARPRGLGSEIATRGSSGSGTEGSGEQKDTGGDAVKQAAEAVAKGQTETNNAATATLNKIVANLAAQKQKLDQLGQKVDALKTA